MMYTHSQWCITGNLLDEYWREGGHYLFFQQWLKVRSAGLIERFMSDVIDIKRLQRMRRNARPNFMQQLFPLYGVCLHNEWS